MKTYAYVYVVHAHTELYSTIKKNEIVEFSTKQMTLEKLVPREVILAQKDKCFMFFLMCTA